MRRVSEVEEIASFRDARRMRKRRLVAAGAAILVLALFAALAAPRTPRVGEAVVKRGTLQANVPFVGTLVPERADTYAPEVPGVELKILSLAPEGTLVNAGDPLVEFDAAPFKKELETAQARMRETSEEERQARSALAATRLAQEGEVRDARSAADNAERELSSLVEADAPITTQQSAHDLEQRRREAESAASKLEGLERFAKEGYISQEEYRAAKLRSEQAAADLALAEAKHAALVRKTLPDLLKKKDDEAKGKRDQAGLASGRAAAQLAQAEAAWRLASARRDEAVRLAGEAEKKIARCRVAARSPGLVVYADLFDKAGERRKVRAGDAVWGGTPVLSLPDLSHVLIEGRVPESDIHRLAAGQPATVRLDAFPNLTLTARLRSVGSLGSSEKNDARSFPVTVALDGSDARFRPGMVGRVSVLSDTLKDVVYVPIEALRVEDGERVCTVVSPIGRAAARTVKVGRTTSRFAEVLSGLAPGETVRLGEP